MPNTRYYNLTEASVYLRIRLLELYKYLYSLQIKTKTFPNQRGEFVAIEEVRFIEACIRGRNVQSSGQSGFLHH